jgi:uncharacterized protein (TIRG00374 family)
VVIAAAGTGALAMVGRSTLTRSVTAFAHLDWAWVPFAVVAESASMASFARSQRRLLRAGGGAPLHLRSVMAITYAGNAISVSLPLAGSEVATGFTFRELSRRGIDAAVAGWALAVSGMFSSVAFAMVIAGGALASGSPTAAALGLTGAVLILVPTLIVLAALRYARVRHGLNRQLERLVRASRRAVGRPGPGAEEALERLLERVAALRLPRIQYLEVFALALWNWVADCLCLAAAMRATGAHVPWQGLFLAYGAGMTAASFGLTPGGLGIVEAALAAALVGAGLTGHRALAAVLVYRLISYWLVMAAGWIVMAMLLLRSDRTRPTAGWGHPQRDRPSAVRLGGGAVVDRGGAGEPRFPPLDRHDPQGQLEGAAVERLGELGDDHDAVGKPTTPEFTPDLHRRVGACPPLPAGVVGGIGVVQQPPEPGDIAGQLDVAVDDLGVHVGVEHHPGPPAQHLVGVRREEGDLRVQAVAAPGVDDGIADGGGEPSG